MSESIQNGFGKTVLKCDRALYCRRKLLVVSGYDNFFTFQINKKDIQMDVPEEMPLLWILRDLLKMTGTKFGCGRGICGSCSVLIDGKLFRSCTVPAGYFKAANPYAIRRTTLYQSTNPGQ